jgi:hypothetical protein
MQIQRSGKTSKEFAESLDKVAKEAPGLAMHPEERLKEDRDEKGHEHTEGTEEQLLGNNRENRKNKLIENNLRDHGSDATVNVVTEKQLNEASGGYPHRNEDAYRRTGDKRPVNALQEEMGEASDAAKRKRFEQASKPGTPRILDKDVGKQLTNEKTVVRKAFNLRQDRDEQITTASGDYLSYRDGHKYNRRFDDVAKLDSHMTRIMSVASNENRNLTEEELVKVAELKAKKSNLLGLSVA